jgi:hypothetical protein
VSVSVVALVAVAVMRNVHSNGLEGVGLDACACWTGPKAPRAILLCFLAWVWVGFRGYRHGKSN